MSTSTNVEAGAGAGAGAGAKANGHHAGESAIMTQGKCGVGSGGNAGVEASENPGAGERKTQKGARELSCDKEFPVDTGTLADDMRHMCNVEWKRPYEICTNPKLFVDGACRLDARQGDTFGNCWLIAACSALAEHPDLVRELIPDVSENDYTENYDGKIAIWLWFGERYKVEIDDRLPTDGSKLVCGACKDSSEFWLPFVEKACAKFQGGYKNLPCRQIAEGLILLTGFSVNRIDLFNDYVKDLFDLLKRELERKSLIICAGMIKKMVRISIAACGNVHPMDTSDEVYHSFTVNKALELSNGTQLVRVRNPWGKDFDVSGKWRYAEDLVQELPQVAKDELLVSPCSDGEYWVDVQNFPTKFRELCIASKNPSVYPDRLVPSTDDKCVGGTWEGNTPGGNINHPNFNNNPQFLFQLDIAENTGKNENVPVLVELIQDLHRDFPVPNSCGFYLYELSGAVAEAQSLDTRPLRRYEREELGPRGAFMLSAGSKAACGAQVVLSEFHQLQAGAKHVVVPWTEASRRSRFLLRLYTADAVVRISQLPARH